MATDVMIGTWTQLQDIYERTKSVADKRTKHWLLMTSPWLTLSILFLYLIMVVVGPKIMKNRKPFDLKLFLVVYNLFITALNFYIAYEIFAAMYILNYSVGCQPIINIDHPEEIRMASAIWWYFFSKIIELIDSMCFILRKKDNQLSFLHVYHHSSMICLWWIGARYVPSGSSGICAFLNSCVHVVMYSYYGLSALGPKIQKYLWWKKYLTVLQLVQFTILFSLGIRALILVPCDFYLWMQCTLVGYMISFIVLFGNFYLHAYIKKSVARRRQLRSTKVEEDEQVTVLKGKYEDGELRHRRNGNYEWKFGYRKL